MDYMSDMKRRWDKKHFHCEKGVFLKYTPGGKSFTTRQA